MVTPGRLEIADHLHADRHTLVLNGDLTVANAQELEETIARLCVDGVEAITIDLGSPQVHRYDGPEGGGVGPGLRDQLPFVDRGGMDPG